MMTTINIYYDILHDSTQTLGLKNCIANVRMFIAATAFVCCLPEKAYTCRKDEGLLA